MAVKSLFHIKNKTKLISGFSVALGIISFVYTTACVLRLDSVVPTTMVNGEFQGEMSKYMLLIMPTIGLLISAGLFYLALNPISFLKNKGEGFDELYVIDRERLVSKKSTELNLWISIYLFFSQNNYLNLARKIAEFQFFVQIMMVILIITTTITYFVSLHTIKKSIKLK